MTRGGHDDRSRDLSEVIGSERPATDMGAHQVPQSPLKNQPVQRTGFFYGRDSKPRQEVPQLTGLHSPRFALQLERRCPIRQSFQPLNSEAR